MNSVAARWLFGLAGLLALTLSSAESRADQTINLAWDASPDNDVVGYNVYYSAVGASSTNQVVVGNGTSASIGSLVSGQTYTFCVTAVNSAGWESAPCAPVSYTVSAAPVVNTAPMLTTVGGQPWTDSSSGRTQLLVNGSFESGYTGWTVSGNQNVRSSSPYQASDGSSAVAFNGGQSTPNGVLSQSFVTTPGQIYTLTFDAGVLAYNQNEQRLQVTVQGSGTLLADTVSVFGIGSGATVWAPQTYSFMADTPVTTLTFQDVSPSTIDLDLMLDNVVVLAPNAPSVPSFSVNAGSTLSLAVTATDADVPANILTYSLVSGPAGASMSPQGLFTWTVDPAQSSGAGTVTVQVTDNGVPPLSDSKSFEVDVLSAVNSPPVLAPVPDQTVPEGTQLVLALNGTDYDLPAQSLTYSLVSGPAGATVSPAGVFSWIPGEAQGPNTVQVTVQVSDNGNPPLTASQTFKVVVLEVNSPPVLAAVPDQVIAAGTQLAVALNASDSDLPAQVLTYSLVSGPTGVSVSSAGVFTWTPSPAQGPSTNKVVVQVSDNGNPPLSASQTFNIVVATVNSAPVLAAVLDQVVAEGNLLTLPLNASDSDVPAQTLTCKLVSGPAGATVSPAGLFSWTPNEAQGPSTNKVVVQVSDDGNPPLSASQSFTVIVTEVNSAPVLAALSDQVVAEGTPLTVSFNASDSDLPIQTLTYRLVSGPAGATVSPAGVFSWTPTEAQGPSTNKVTVQVTDNGNPPLSASQSFTVVVTEVNSPPTFNSIADQTVSAGQTLTLAVTAVDPDIPANKLTYRLVSGPSGAALDATSGVFTWRVSKSATSSTNQVIVSVSDDGSPVLSDMKSFRVIVLGKTPRVASTHPLVSTRSSVSWLAEAGGGHEVRFTCPIPAGAEPGSSTVYLEASPDLENWVTLGELSDEADFRDTGANGAAVRFYRVRTEPAPSQE